MSPTPTYPDVSAVCGDPEFTTPKQTTLVNPSLVVEVLSERTQAYDRGENLDAYRGLASVSEIVILWQDRRAAAVYRREATGRWSIEDVGMDGVLALASVGVDVAPRPFRFGTAAAERRLLNVAPRLPEAVRMGFRPVAHGLTGSLHASLPATWASSNFSSSCSGSSSWASPSSAAFRPSRRTAARGGPT